VQIAIAEVTGVHRSLPNVRHVQQQIVKSESKLEVLRDVLARHHSKNMRTLVFCNTVNSCRAVEYAINQDALAGGSFGGGGGEGEVHAISYHGELNSAEREKNLQLFREGKPFSLATKGIV
jgi:superfamily II DNA/RNA helicase